MREWVEVRGKEIKGKQVRDEGKKQMRWRGEKEKAKESYLRGS